MSRTNSQYCETPSPMSDQPHSILIVDDEPANLILLEELLQAEGYQILSATSGGEAIEAAKTSFPDLVLLDVMMPDMDGFEVCDYFRKDEQLKTIPVIFLTALDDDQSRLRGLELMGDDYITKPFNMRLLIAKVASTLQLNQMRSQSAVASSEALEQNSQDIKQISEEFAQKFRLFVPEQYLERIAPQGVESIQIGNFREEQLTILFCDIRGFTTIAESQQASETYTWLNVFFEQMGACISSNSGFIDKYLGDAILAVFDRHHFHSQDALNAAIMMQKSLINFNENRHQLKLKEPLKVGIGIDTGIGMIGTLGSEFRMDSTVIGDVVNTASRLEGLTKVYGCPILVSQATVSQVKSNSDLFDLRLIDQVTPRGKQNAIDIYELFGNKNYVIFPNKLRTKKMFNEGIKAWKSKNLTQALSYFKQVIEQDTTDAVAQLYVERCQDQIKQIPDSLI